MLRIKDPHNLVAYFSMEIGIDPEIPTYSGGLGVLAGDTLRSFADLGIPAVAVTLLSEDGYFTQEIRNGQQVELFKRWEVERYLDQLPHEVVVRSANQEIHLRLWQYQITGIHNHKIPIIFLDSNHPQNPPEIRKLTQRLYPSNMTFRLLQEVILGVGGVRALQKLTYQPSVYHLNEGHSSFLTIELLRQALEANRPHALEDVRKRCVFTTHTPVLAGHDRFPKKLVQEKFEYYSLLEEIPQAFDAQGNLNMTSLALAMSYRINGVAKKHAVVSHAMFPNYTISAITNGIHHRFWTSPPFHELFDKYIPGWHEDPFILYSALNIPKAEIEAAHQVNKRRLIKYIKDKSGVNFDEKVMIIGYARRMTRYKRPDLIFYDLKRLKSIARKYPFYLVFAGKAHPEDLVGKSLIREIIGLREKLQPEIKLVFLEGYDINLAKMLIPGVDLWLNTPKRPLEASGTSGMKASLNGVPNFSVQDGWWLEGHMEDITGWSIGPQPVFNQQLGIECVDCDDSEDLYNKLENKILPLFYNNPVEFSRVRRHAVALHGSYFNTHRMVQQYVIKSYLI